MKVFLLLLVLLVPDCLLAEELEPLPLKDLQHFVEIMNKVRRDALHPVGTDRLLEGAIAGMLNAVDANSDYLGKDEFAEMQARPTAASAGVGLELVQREGRTLVVAPIDEAPAAKAGIQSGDILLSVDGEPVAGLRLKDIVARLRGPIGSLSRLSLITPGAPQSRNYALVRELVKAPSAKAWLLDGGIACLRLASFTSGSGRSANEALKGLKPRTDTPVRGLVLDLRNNPGGVVDGVRAASGLFFEPGTLLVSIRGREVEDARQLLTPDAGADWRTLPMAVLINKGSAAGAEMLAGALQDHHRAIVLGEPSFGRGSIQTIFPLTDGAAIKLTTAEWQTPGGHRIDGQGIVPELLVADGEVLERARLLLIESAAKLAVSAGPVK